MLAIDDKKLRRFDQDFVVVFVHAHEVRLCVLQEDASAIVLFLKVDVLYASNIEHWHVDLVNISVKLIQVVHLVDKEVYLSVLSH